MNISTDKIIAIGLVIVGIVYAVGSIILGVPASGELLGTLFGGIIGALGRWAPQQPVETESKTAQTLGKIADTAGQARNVVNAVENMKGIVKKEGV